MDIVETLSQQQIVLLWKPIIILSWSVYASFQIPLILDYTYNPNPLCPYDHYDYPQWYWYSNYTCLGGIVTLWINICFRLLKENHSQLTVPIYITLNIITMTMLSYILSIALNWGGICIDQLNVATPAVIWGEWIGNGFVLMFITMTINRYTPIMNIEWLMMVIFSICMFCGFLIIPDQPRILAQFWLCLSCLLYLPVGLLPFVNSNRPLHNTDKALGIVVKSDANNIIDKNTFIYLSILLSIILPAYAFIYLLACFNVLTYPETITLFNFANLVCKGIFAMILLDVHSHVLNVLQILLKQETTHNIEKISVVKLDLLKYVLDEITSPLENVIKEVDVLLEKVRRKSILITQSKLSSNFGTHTATLALLKKEWLDKHSKHESIVFDSCPLNRQSCCPKETYRLDVNNDTIVPNNDLSFGNDRNNDDDVEYGYLESIKTSSVTMKQVLNNLSFFHENEIHRIKLDYSFFCINTVIINTLKIFESNSMIKHLNIEKELDKNTPRLIYADKVRIEHVISNLISNAIKYSFEHGNIHIKTEFVSISPRRMSSAPFKESPNRPKQTKTLSGFFRDNLTDADDEKMNEESNTKMMMTFYVTDEGIGISEDKKPNLFKSLTKPDDNKSDEGSNSSRIVSDSPSNTRGQPNALDSESMGDSSNHSHDNGFGLGLSFCKKIVELHNGKIDVHTRLNIGSTFFFSIPVETKQSGTRLTSLILKQLSTDTSNNHNKTDLVPSNESPVASDDPNFFTTGTEMLTNHPFISNMDDISLNVMV